MMRTMMQINEGGETIGKTKTKIWNRRLERNLVRNGELFRMTKRTKRRRTPRESDTEIGGQRINSRLSCELSRETVVKLEPRTRWTSSRISLETKEIGI
jgi:hypothetical protein